jgi:uncharacterized protein
MKLRLSVWAPLRNLADINHRLLLPILFHCVDDQGRPLLGPPRQGPDTDQFRRTAYKDIPAVVKEMRQYWMPTISSRNGSWPASRSIITSRSMASSTQFHTA